MLVGDTADATLVAGLKIFGYSFVGGAVVGLVVGRLAASVLPMLGDIASAETAFTMALPYPLYLLANDVLHVSGVSRSSARDSSSTVSDARDCHRRTGGICKWCGNRSRCSPARSSSCSPRFKSRTC